MGLGFVIVWVFVFLFSWEHSGSGYYLGKMVTVYFHFFCKFYRALSLLFCALSVLTAVSQHVTGKLGWQAHRVLGCLWDTYVFSMEKGFFRQVKIKILPLGMGGWWLGAAKPGATLACVFWLDLGRVGLPYISGLVSASPHMSKNSSQKKSWNFLEPCLEQTATFRNPICWLVLVEKIHINCKRKSLLELELIWLCLENFPRGVTLLRKSFQRDTWVCWFVCLFYKVFRTKRN